MSKRLANFLNRNWWPYWLGESSYGLSNVQSLECHELAIGYAPEPRSGLLAGKRRGDGGRGAADSRRAAGGHGASGQRDGPCGHGGALGGAGPGRYRASGSCRAQEAAAACKGGEASLHAGLNLRFEAGLVHGILGENGSGKSCLIKTLAGLVKPLAGDISLQCVNSSRHDGDDSLSLAQHGRTLEPMAKRSAWQGYLQQEAQVHWDLPVRDIVALGASARRDWSRAERRAAVDKVMEACDCLSLAARPVLQLSTGERQRVMLGRVMAAQPQVLLVDEPTAGLDPRHQHGMMQLLRDVAQNGVIVIAVMHDIELTRRYCDTALLLNRSQCLNFASAVGCNDQAPGAGFAQGPVADVLTVEAVRRVFGIG